MPDIDKLPRWAREHIRTLERQREAAEAALVSKLSEQAESPFYMEAWESIGPTPKPTLIRHYINAHSIHYEGGGIRIQIRPEENGVLMYFEKNNRCVGSAAIVPQASNAIKIVPIKE